MTLLLAACNSSQYLDCSKFKTGKFSYLSNRSGNKYIIERNDSTQIERNLNTGSITTLRIKWTSECEYDLTYISRQSSPNDTLLTLTPKSILKTKIIEVGSNFCIFSSQAIGMTHILTDTLKIF
jgi:hypothetical protein